MITRLNRLARSTWALLNILATIAEKGTGFRSLGDGWADATTPHGRLTLTVLGGIVEFERERIQARDVRMAPSRNCPFTSSMKLYVGAISVYTYIFIVTLKNIIHIIYNIF